MKYSDLLNGITGANIGEMATIRQKVENIRIHTDLPVCVGFGVKTPQQASDVAEFSDGVVVGSHFVGQIPAHSSNCKNMQSAINHAAQAMKTAIQA